MVSNLKPGITWATRICLVAVQQTGRDHHPMNGKVENKGDSLTAIENPKIGETYWVQCKGHRCMAVMGMDGEWVAFATGKVVTGILKVYST
jgi:hypothetical protein